MKLSPKTLTILKNYASINPGVVLKPGSMLSTISPTKTIVAKATVPETFERIVGLYNLSRFLGTHSLLDNPEVDFKENHLEMVSGAQSVVYHYTDASNIPSPPDKNLELPSVDAEFTLTNKDLQVIVKALGVLGLDEIIFVGDGETIKVKTGKAKDPSSDAFSIDIGSTDSVFKAVFNADNLKIIDGDYNVKICAKGIAQFIGVDVTYWIAVEASSEF